MTFTHMVELVSFIDDIVAEYAGSVEMCTRERGRPSTERDLLVTLLNGEDWHGFPTFVEVVHAERRPPVINV